MNTKPVFPWVLAAATLLAGRTALATSETDVSWIGTLPGVSLRTSKATLDGPKSVYAVSGDVRATMQSVREGLTTRGWTIQKSTDVPVADVVAASSLIAHKEGAVVKVAGSSAMGISNLTVTTLRGGGGAEPRSAEASTRRSNGTTGSVLDAVEMAVKGAQVGTRAVGVTTDGLTLIENGLTGSYACNDRDVTVMGNSCRITLEGNCRTLRVYGNGNTVHVDAQAQAIHTLGERNTVKWSIEKNATAPRVTNLGGGNRIQAGER